MFRPPFESLIVKNRKIINFFPSFIIIFPILTQCQGKKILNKNIADKHSFSTESLYLHVMYLDATSTVKATVQGCYIEVITLTTDWGMLKSIPQYIIPEFPGTVSQQQSINRNSSSNVNYGNAVNTSLTPQYQQAVSHLRQPRLQHRPQLCYHSQKAENSCHLSDSDSC